MLNDAHPALTFGRKLLLAGAGILAIAGPVAIGMMNAPRLRAQAADEGAAFAQASVTAHAPGDTRFYPLVMTDRRFTATNMRLHTLLLGAYPGVRLEGAPEWFDSDRFDVDATASEPATNAQMWSMVRTLLKDRFKLSLHEDTRLRPVYALVLIAADGTLGEQIRPSACTGKGTIPQGNWGPDNPPPAPCGSTQTRPGRLVARWQTMSELATGLSPTLGTRVIDRTGLTGKYDLEAQWTPAPGPPGPAALGIGPATFTALEEQLGLKLASETGPVQFLVIDRAERP
jgi:uncharacterized protein (TIGR03435 family)